MCAAGAGTIAMDREEAKRLREAWSKLGNPECRHKIFELETEKEYMTGSYVCTQCGKRTQLQDTDT
jgi:ssDNA-binding Zn-finger/Zn-ribbon topoisomerase 1